MKLKESKAVFSALADETRLRILNLLTEGELCVCDLMNVLRQPQSKISRHLAYLRRTGLAESRKQGLWMYYRLSPKTAKMFTDVWNALPSSSSGFHEFKHDLASFRKNKKCLVACCK